MGVIRALPAAAFISRATMSASVLPAIRASATSRAATARWIRPKAARRNSAIAFFDHAPIGCDQSSSGQASNSLGRIAMTAPACHGSGSRPVVRNRALFVPPLGRGLLGS